MKIKTFERKLKEYFEYKFDVIENLQKDKPLLIKEISKEITQLAEDITVDELWEQENRISA